MQQTMRSVVNISVSREATTTNVLALTPRLGVTFSHSGPLGALTAFGEGEC